MDNETNAFFKDFIRKSGAKIIASLWKFTKSEKIAEDLFLDTLADYYVKLKQERIKPAKDLKAYITRMAKNRWIDGYRKKKGDNTELGNEEIADKISESDKANFKDFLISNEENQALNKELSRKKAAVLKALDRLCEMCELLVIERMLYRTSYAELLTYPEIKVRYTKKNSLTTVASECRKKFLTFCYEFYDNSDPEN